MDKLASDLERALISRTGSADDALRFWSLIPKVRACCNEASVFEDEFAAPAYAYVHLLERYRRTWLVLKHLTRYAVLPLGTKGVGALDIGAGPAPALYAIDDYYRALSDFAVHASIDELHLPSPTLAAVERSGPMISFSHYLSELGDRHGPFGADFRDFSGLDLSAARSSYFHPYEVQWDPETREYVEVDNPSSLDEANSMFRYRIVVMSNFLTVDSSVDGYRQELERLFRDLRPGAIAIVLGATGDAYQQIYRQLAQLAHNAGLTSARGWHTDSLGRKSEAASRRIKLSQYRVFAHLASIAGAEALEKGKAWPDYWSPDPSPRARPQFALRVFRKGRWLGLRRFR